MELGERLSDMLERDGIGCVVRELQLCFGFSTCELFVLDLQLAQPLYEQVVVYAASLEKFEEPLALALDGCQFLVDCRQFLLERGDTLYPV